MNNMVTAANKDKLHCIGEAEATTGRIVVRYIYSGNEKIAMERVDAQSGARSWYYFINNAQGTPVLILDESGGTISRVNLDEWGNVGQLIGPASEVNYTGKKAALSQPGSGYASLGVRRILVSPLWGEHGEANVKSPETGLYYFNQRYYDPSLGRFLTEDPAGQGLNPYAYAGMLVRDSGCESAFATSLSLINPDGEFFWALAVVMFKAAVTSAAINAGVQLVTTGEINWNSVGQSALSGALSGGLSYGIGELGQALNLGENLAFKTMAHGVSGGIQSAVFGGDFGSGFAGGVAGNLGGHMMGDDLSGRIGAGALAGGVGSMVAGGNFWQGAQSGAYNQAFNWGMHEGMKRLFEIWPLYLKEPSAQYIEESFESPISDLLSTVTLIDPYGAYPGSQYVERADLFFTFGKYPVHMANISRLIAQDYYYQSKNSINIPVHKNGNGGASRSW